MTKKFWTGDEVKRVRNFLSLNQMPFAKRLGVSQAAITGWEKSGVAETKASRILREFGLTADDCKKIGVRELRAVSLNRAVIFHGADLAAFRKAHKISQGDLAKRLHVTQACISVWENSENLPSDAVESLAIAYDGAKIVPSTNVEKIRLNVAAERENLTRRERVKSMVDRVPDVHLPSLETYISGLATDGPRAN